MSVGSGNITERQRADIIARAKLGQRPKAIAEALYLSPKAVTLLVSAARTCGENIPFFYAVRGGSRAQTEEGAIASRTLAVGAEVARNVRAGLETAAARRGWSLDFLVGEVLTVLVNDELIDAVLDDKGNG